MRSCGAPGRRRPEFATARCQVEGLGEEAARVLSRGGRQAEQPHHRRGDVHVLSLPRVGQRVVEGRILFPGQDWPRTPARRRSGAKKLSRVCGPPWLPGSGCRTSPGSENAPPGQCVTTSRPSGVRPCARPGVLPRACSRPAVRGGSLPVERLSRPVASERRARIARSSSKPLGHGGPPGTPGPRFRSAPPRSRCRRSRRALERALVRLVFYERGVHRVVGQENQHGSLPLTARTQLTDEARDLVVGLTDAGRRRRGSCGSPRP